MSRVRTVLQRVTCASVAVDGQTIGEIGPGLLCYLGIGHGDDESKSSFMAQKVAGLRIFPDESGKMTRSLMDTTKDILVISQFTLYGDCRRGRRPSFSNAAPPVEAEALYHHFIEELSNIGLNVQKGKFGANMAVSSVNDGPVTLLIDSEGAF